MDALYWPYLLFVMGAVSVTISFLSRMRAGKRKKQRLARVKGSWSLKAGHSVTPEEVKRAEDEVRVLDVEREVLSFALRRLYESAVEGKISEEERDRLATRYKERMTEVIDTISRSKSIVTLHELEGMQENLIKLFSEHFNDLNQKIEDLRTRLEIRPLEKAPAPLAAPPQPAASEKRKGKKTKRAHPSPPRKTEAEKRIERIRGEVEKALERLEQIEAEV